MKTVIKARIELIEKKLRAAYPHVKTQLNFRNPFELLVATILSAQCTDKQVNAVTPALFARLPTPRDMAAAPLETLEALVRSTGYFHNKARNIQNCARALAEKNGGRVPASLEELVELPGVGRKTANVVLGAAFDIPGIVVDTHVGRISGRLGLTRHTDPVKIEFDLMRILPREHWNGFCLRLIHFGRAVCTARKPKCGGCPLYALCPYPDKTA